MSIRQHFEDPTKFVVDVDYMTWQYVSKWLRDNNIRWHACGDKTIQFDNAQVSTLFALKWL